jgi:hypothetical protein
MGSMNPDPGSPKKPQKKKRNEEYHVLKSCMHEYVLLEGGTEALPVFNKKGRFFSTLTFIYFCF